MSSSRRTRMAANACACSNKNQAISATSKANLMINSRVRPEKVSNCIAWPKLLNLIKATPQRHKQIMKIKKRSGLVPLRLKIDLSHDRRVWTFPKSNASPRSRGIAQVLQQPLRITYPRDESETTLSLSETWRNVVCFTINPQWNYHRLHATGTTQKSKRIRPFSGQAAQSKSAMTRLPNSRRCRPKINMSETHPLR